MHSKSKSVQAPSSIMMIRPHHFRTNGETAADNAFQSTNNLDSAEISKRAFDEVTDAIIVLEGVGIQVHLFEDDGQETPDSVFPNNWFSTHPGGHIAIYPMYAKNRRLERRWDIIELLKQRYRVQDVIDYSGLEPDGLFLEGTGAMVLDHIDRVAYAIESNRTNPVALERFCTHFNYEPMVFDARDRDGKTVYHTNVLMCIATDFAMIGLDMISDSSRRDEIVARLEDSGRQVIPLSDSQIASFSGNAIELQGKDGRVLAISQSAYDSLDKRQMEIIETYSQLVPLNVSTIEMSGGSIRCMIAGIHLTAR